MNHTSKRWLAVAASALSLVVLAPAVHAAPSASAADPAAIQIEGFDTSLIDVMRQAKTLGLQGRFHKLEPVVAHAFDIPTMIRFAVGPSWATIPAGQQQALTEAFARLTVASFAHNFSGYSGQSFQVSPNV